MKLYYIGLCSLSLAGCAVVNNYPAGGPSMGARQEAPPQPTAWQWRSARAYRNKVSRMVARANRDIRVAEEQQKIDKFGHPVPLPIGICDATVVVNSHGEVEHVRMLNCSSTAIAKVDRRAIYDAAPFGPPPSGVRKIEIVNWDPGATPGARDPAVSTYVHGIAAQVARSVRRIRVAKERERSNELKHPVPLPIGTCHALITVSARGLVQHIRIFACSSEALDSVERQAIESAAPFRLPPSGVHEVAIATSAWSATPGQ